MEASWEATPSKEGVASVRDPDVAVREVIQVADSAFDVANRILRNRRDGDRIAYYNTAMNHAHSAFLESFDVLHETHGARGDPGHSIARSNTAEVERPQLDT